MIRKTIQFFTTILLILINCSEPEDFSELEGEWLWEEREVKLFGTSSIEQVAIDRSQSVPTTLNFSVEEEIQFDHVTISENDSVLIIELYDSPFFPDHHLDLRDSLGSKSILFRFHYIDYLASGVIFNYDRSSAILTIESAALQSYWGESISVSGSVEFPHYRLLAGKISLIQLPDPRFLLFAYPIINIHTFELLADNSCSVTYGWPLDSPAFHGTWAATNNKITFDLPDTTSAYKYDLENDIIKLELDPLYYDSDETEFIESFYGLIEGSMSLVSSIGSTYYTRNIE
ncbi:hypothetical protein HQ531_14780 [bacterium]|nr:hypothetical protein [bacterium]